MPKKKARKKAKKKGDTKRPPQGEWPTTDQALVLVLVVT